MPPVPRERTTAPAVRQISSKYAPWFLPCNGHTQKEYRGVSLPAGVPRGKYNKPSAHGEGYIKRFLDTSSILVGSTKRVLDEHLLFQRRLRRQGFALIRTKNAILDKSLRWRFFVYYDLLSLKKVLSDIIYQNCSGIILWNFKRYFFSTLAISCLKEFLKAFIARSKLKSSQRSSFL